MCHAKRLRLQQLDCHWGEVLIESRPRLLLLRVAPLWVLVILVIAHWMCCSITYEIRISRQFSRDCWSFGALLYGKSFSWLWSYIFGLNTFLTICLVYVVTRYKVDDSLHNFRYYETCFRAVRVLLKFDADPNLPDEFSNVYLVAREKGLNSLQGMAICFLLMHD